MTIFVICVGSSLLSKATDVTHVYKYNITFIEKYFIGKNQQSRFFNIFCLQSQLSGCIIHRLVEYSSKKEKN